MSDDLSACEWQRQGADTWVLGPKVRGIVRNRITTVYYDEGCGWKCLIRKPDGFDRHLMGSLPLAVGYCEYKLGIAEEPSS